ncbi:tyrosine-type recombinase/integrase [Asanoa siamensis]|uniref:Prophage phiRv2 integrase n=1 Tax=Asanoa siamensis TaxID=926357 RepID=A0ABQ4CI64_9ACTN|nr:tyrosine-type recombinase/integrase [Asanoa siamensis]GIF70983.1 putative prophage phiRv2 integrase [Asanoa siamensis]
MAAQKGRRRFGSVRKLPSGQFQARYLGPDGIQRTAPNTFATRPKAEKWLTVKESEVIKGEWTAPEAAEITVAVYGRRWIEHRKLAPTTRERYEDLFRLYVEPHLGKLALGAVYPATIRSWRAALLDGGCTEPQAVKAYTMLRAIFMTAVRDDEILPKNPCRVRGFDTYHTPERPTATVDQVHALADAMPARFKALIIVAAFSGLRWGELAALRRSDVDLDAKTVRVHRKLAALRTGMAFGPPKTKAGVRTVALPGAAAAALRAHLKAGFVPDDVESLIFTGEKGALLRSGNFLRATRWAEATKAAGLGDGFHFHDLRHTGNTLAAASGASTRELMNRLGQSSMRAALGYQHAVAERDREIADAMDKRIRRAGTRKKSRKS